MGKWWDDAPDGPDPLYKSFWQKILTREGSHYYTGAKPEFVAERPTDDYERTGLWVADRRYEAFKHVVDIREDVTARAGDTTFTFGQIPSQFLCVEDHLSTDANKPNALNLRGRRDGPWLLYEGGMFVTTETLEPAAVNQPVAVANPPPAFDYEFTMDQLVESTIIAASYRPNLRGQYRFGTRQTVNGVSTGGAYAALGNLWTSVRDDCTEISFSDYDADGMHQESFMHGVTSDSGFYIVFGDTWWIGADPIRGLVRESANDSRWLVRFPYGWNTMNEAGALPHVPPDVNRVRFGFVRTGTPTGSPANAVPRNVQNFRAQRAPSADGTAVVTWNAPAVTPPHPTYYEVRHRPGRASEASRGWSEWTRATDFAGRTFTATGLAAGWHFFEVRPGNANGHGFPQNLELEIPA